MNSLTNSGPNKMSNNCFLFLHTIFPLFFPKLRRRRAMSDYIPQDVLAEILLRLPVKSLLRFRSVSKSWYSIISSPAFVSLYSGEHLHRRRPTQFLFSRYVNSFTQILTFHPDDNFFPTKQEQIPWPFHYPSNFHIVGSCNGLLCIFFRQSGALCLWNPAIRKHLTVELPPEMIIGGRRRNRYTAFMFGFVANEYKIATIEGSYFGNTFITYHGGGTNMYIYELSKNSWRKKETDSNSKLVESNGSGQVSYNGAVHWIGRDVRRGGLEEENRRWKVICFDMGNECYREMGLPEGLSSDEEMEFSLTVTETMSFGLVQFKLWDSGCGIWAMEEYGEARSWKKILAVDLRFEGGTMRNVVVKRVVFREKKKRKNGNGGMLLLTATMEVGSYDGDGGSGRVVSVGEDGKRVQIVDVNTYRESLALLL